MDPELILHNGKITTLDRKQPEVEALVVQDGRVVGLGTNSEILPLGSAKTRVVDVGGPRVDDLRTHRIGRVLRARRIRERLA